MISWAVRELRQAIADCIDDGKKVRLQALLEMARAERKKRAAQPIASVSPPAPHSFLCHPPGELLPLRARAASPRQ